MLTQPTACISQRFGDPSPQTEILLERFRRRLPTPHRPPYQGHGKEDEKAGYPVLYESDMVYNIEANVTTYASCYKIYIDLPYIVINMPLQQLSAGPSAKPLGQVTIHEVQVGYRVSRDLCFDARAVELPGHYPDFAVLRRFSCRVPAHRFFGTPTWLARVS